MRTTLFLVFLAFAAGRAAADSAAPPRSWTHVRPLSAGAATLLASATERSSIMRDIVEALERTDVVVYLSDSMSGSEREPAAYLQFVGRAAGTRYLLVRIDPWLSAPWVRIAQLAHELQHAMEVSLAPEVQDAAGLAQLYRRIGWEGREGRFETADARVIGDRVRNELVGFSRW